MGFSRVTRVAETGSTNADLMAALSAGGAWPHLSVLVADSQVAGRGRGDAVWQTTPGTALTCSVAIDPDGAPQVPLTWFPMVVGLAVRKALAPWSAAGLKWPNDVVAKAPHPDPAWGWGPKLAGILCERHASGTIVAGIGVNLLQTPEQLPVPWAGSVASLTGSAPTPAELIDPLGAALSAYLATDLAALSAAYLDASTVIGAHVAVTLPDERGVTGIAVGIDNDGALLLRPGSAPTDSLQVDAAEWRSLDTLRGADSRGNEHVMRITAGEARRLRGTLNV